MKSEVDQKLLIIGYGNELRSDDYVGRRVAQELARRGMPAIDVNQLTPELAERISQVKTVCFIDASAVLEPGAIQVREVHEVSNRTVDHHIDPGALLRLCRELCGRSPTALIVTIGVESFEFGIGLSNTALEAVQIIVDSMPMILNSPDPRPRLLR